MNQTLIATAVTGLLALGLAAAPAHADETEKCWGVTKAGQNACNSNKSKHSCAGHSNIDNDPNDFIPPAQRDLHEDRRQPGTGGRQSQGFRKILSLG